MSLEITLEQIKALKADYLRDLDLSDSSSLIFNFYGVEGKQAQELYQTACLTQERLLAGMAALTVLLVDVIGISQCQDDCNLEYVAAILLMLPDIVNLIRGINTSILCLAYEAKRFELKSI